MKKTIYLISLFLLIFAISCSSNKDKSPVDLFYEKFVEAHPDGYDIPRQNFKYSFSKTLQENENEIKIIKRDVLGNVDFERYYFSGKIYKYIDTKSEVTITDGKETYKMEEKIYYDGKNYYYEKIEYNGNEFYKKVSYGTSSVKELELNMINLSIYYPDNSYIFEYYPEYIYVNDNCFKIYKENDAIDEITKIDFYYDENYELTNAKTTYSLKEQKEKYISTFEFIDDEFEVDVPKNYDINLNNLEDIIVLY